MLIIEGWLLDYDKQPADKDRFERDFLTVSPNRLYPLVVYPGADMHYSGENPDRFFKPYGWAKLRFCKKGIFCRCYIPDIDELLPEYVPSAFAWCLRKLYYEWCPTTKRRIIYGGYLESIALAPKTGIPSSSITSIRIVDEKRFPESWRILDQLEKELIGF